MRKRVAFVRNKYYSDSGMDYVFERLHDELNKRNILLFLADNLYAGFPFEAPDCDYAVFWDKDVALARALEGAGVRLFNSARATELCDDKEKTFAALSGKIGLPRTVVAPLVYDVSSGEDERFIDFIENEIAYPAVVKECVGSQGRQVYLAENRTELTALHRKLAHVPHLFQRFVEGKRAGSDTRVYVVGKKAVGAVERLNTTDFRSNTFLGGKMSKIPLKKELAEKAETIAEMLNLDYGSTDFICENGEYVFIEANSSAYMKNAEANGIPLAELFAEHIAEVACES